MYKVFIDNSSIIFLTKRVLTALHNISGSTIVYSVAELNKQIKAISNEKLIYVVCADPKASRNYFFSSYQIIPAAGGIVQREDEFLFIKRLGVWDIPKGKIEADEKTKVAAIREIEEECGIEKPVILSKLVKTHHTYTFKGKKAIKKTTWYHLSYDGSKKTTPQLEENIEEACWFKQKDFALLKTKTYASIKSVIEALEIKLAQIKVGSSSKTMD